MVENSKFMVHLVRKVLGWEPHTYQMIIMRRPGGDVAAPGGSELSIHVSKSSCLKTKFKRERLLRISIEAPFLEFQSAQNSDIYIYIYTHSF